MADLSRYLPLSNRPRGDESGVTSDRRDAIGDLIDEAARLLEGVAPARAATVVDAFFTGARLRSTPPDTGDLSGRLTAAAAGVRAGQACSIRHLGDALRALLLLAREVGRTPDVDPITSGAVALYGATSGPFERRVVLRGHTLRASGGEWEFGHGPVLEGDAIEIAAFVLGVSDVPPQPASQTPHVAPADERR